MFSPNDVLLDQTILCGASRLFEGHPRKRAYEIYGPSSPFYDKRSGSNAERLFNLSLLLDGLALHDKVYVLGAELPRDAATLQLRQQKGIVKQIETAPYAPKILQEFEQFFSKLSVPSGMGHGSVMPGTTETIIQAVDSF